MSTVNLANGQAMTAIDASILFVFGEDTGTPSYAWKQLTSVGASATLVDGAVTAQDYFLLEDATLVTVGSFYQFGATATNIARIIAADPVSRTILLDRGLTVADNDTVKPITLAAATITGLSFNTSTGRLTGTPTVNGSTLNLLYEMTDASSQKAYSTPYDIVVATPPVPPSFAGRLNDESFTNGDTVSLDWSVGFILVSTYSLAGTLPTGLSFNTGTAHVTGTVAQEGSFGPFVVTGTNGVSPDASSNSIAMTVSAVVVVPPDEGAECCIPGGFDFTFGFGFTGFGGARTVVLSGFLTEDGDSITTEAGDALVTQES